MARMTILLVAMAFLGKTSAPRLWSSNGRPSNGELGVRPAHLKAADSGIESASRGRLSQIDDVTFVSLTAGDLHTCGLVDGGAAYCWGSNEWGSLGDGTKTMSLIPKPVAAGLKFVSLSAGTRYTCGLATDGKAYCWGSNQYGNLGDGTLVDRWIPTRVVGGQEFVSLSAGGTVTCGLTAAGVAYCWGYNAFGQIGDGTTTDRSLPTVVSGGYAFSELHAGGFHACGLTQEGAAFCWGWNRDGQIGDGTPTGDGLSTRLTPVAVTGGLSFSKLETGTFNSCGSVIDGFAVCWGQNNGGQLGDGSITSRSTPIAPVGVDLESIYSGNANACGLAPDGAAYCWGNNSSGNVGDGTSGNYRLTPTAVSDIDVHYPLRFRVLTASQGGAHNCGITYAGETYCWGDNNQGPLGDGTILNRSIPTKVLNP